MNERIKELLEEAHRQTKGGIYNGHPSDWTEKFAELIVRECAEICYNRDYTDGSAYGEAIEEHFGVEE